MSCSVSVHALLAITLHCSMAAAQERISTTPLAVGDPAFVGTATSASGLWAKRYPFDPATFGKTRGNVPGAPTSDPTIVIYTTSLSPAFLKLARRVDTFVGEHPELRSSGIYLLEEKGAQAGGYTVAELSQRITRLKEIATENKLGQLSTAIAANSDLKARQRLGLDEIHDAAIVYFAKGTKSAMVRWIERVATDKLDDNDLNKFIDSLNVAHESNKLRKP